MTSPMASGANYDSLGKQEQAVVRKQWAGRAAALRGGLDYEVEFKAAEESYSELDADGNVVIRTAHAAQTTGNAATSIEIEVSLLTGTQVAQLLNSGSKSAAVRSVDYMRARGELLHVRRLNEYVYPGFQFDRAIRQVKPFVKTLLQLAIINGWEPEDVVLWLCSPTTYFEDGSRPVDHLDAEPELVIDVARRAWGIEW